MDLTREQIAGTRSAGQNPIPKSAVSHAQRQATTMAAVVRAAVPAEDPGDTDSSDRSPEPSPEAPPAPERFENGHNNNHHLRTPARQALTFAKDGPGSPFRLEAPSPYSPLPPSLLSGDDNGSSRRRAKSSARRPYSTVRRPTRPPLQEVSLLRAHDLTMSRTFESEESMEEQLQQLTSVLTAPSPVLNIPTPTSVRSRSSTQLLPAVLDLKKQLVESHQSLFLMQEENKALGSEIDRLSAEYASYKADAEKEMSEAQSSQAKLRASEARLAGEKKALEAKQTSLFKQLESLRQLEAELEQTKVVKTSLEKRVESLETAQTKADSKLIAVEQGNKRLEEELAAAKASIMDAGKEREHLEKVREELHAQLLDVRTKHKTSSGDSSARIKSLEKEVTRIRSEKEAAKAAQQLEIDRLTAVLRETERKLAKASNESTETTAVLQEKVARLDALCKDSSNKNGALRAEKMALRREVTQLKEQLQQRTRQASQRPPTSEIGCQTATERVDSSVQTDTPMSTATVPTYLDTGRMNGNQQSITDRLGRIRDAAERATFLQDYRREVSRLKADHERQVHELEESHDATLRKIVSDAKEELHSQTKEYKRRVKADYETKIAALERKHQEDLARTRQEMEANAVTTSEAVRAAVAEVSSTQQQLEQEVSKRLELEQAVDDLQRQLSDSQNAAATQRDWEQETSEILARIQRECNAVFEKRATSSKGASPRSVIWVDEVPMNSLQRPQPGPPAPAPRRASPVQNGGASAWTRPASRRPTASVQSELDRALDETEALVRSLVENELRV